MKSKLTANMFDGEFTRYLIECRCVSADHMLVFDFDIDCDFVDVQFVSTWHPSFWHRIKMAAVFIFKKGGLHTSDSVGFSWENIEDLEEVIAHIKQKKAMNEKSV